VLGARAGLALAFLVDDVPVVLDPSIKALMPDPSTLRDMDKGAARPGRCHCASRAHCVFRDYDVDGACSSALMQRFLGAHGLDARIYIPDRLFEGYGPNPAAIETLARDGAKLIVTVDCGTTSIAPLAVAGPLGADVVVVDHHQADERLPDVAAVINPNRQDDLSGLGHLCAAGVTFMFLVATSRRLRLKGHYTAAKPAPDLLALLDLVALATVCDVVPLKGLNRAFVTRGLQVMRQRRNVGLRALADAAGWRSRRRPYHLGFVLGPRINAGGRIRRRGAWRASAGDRDEMDAARIAVVLDKLNRERKAVEAQMLDEAVALADGLVEADPDVPLLLLGSESWHKGVVGWSASRLVERFRRPACAIAWDSKEEGTGSLRSIDGVDIGAAVRAAVEVGHLKKGGGHAMAAGLTVARGELAALEAFMRERLAASTGAARTVAALDLDGALTPVSVNDELMG
jgi:single-stranded-DNA-specific exonuclease